MREPTVHRLSQWYRITSSIARAVGLCAVVATNVVSQPTHAPFQPSRCVRDTTTALEVRTEVATADSVAPGIHYRCLYIPRGPWALHVVSIDLRAGRYVIDGERAFAARLGREKVSDMTKRLLARADTPLVAINADFFNLQTGEIENNTVVRGEWVKGVVLSDSPHDQFDNAHTQFAVDETGRPLIGRFELNADVTSGTTRASLLGINHRPIRADGLVLYTNWFGSHTPRDSSTRDVVELALERQTGEGTEGSYRVAAAGLTNGGGSPILPGGVVLSATGSAATYLRQLSREGGSVHISARLGDARAKPRTVVGGWPRLLVDGRNVGAIADSLEGTMPRFSSARHPRSAIGVSRDSSVLMFVVVDGRRPWSAGMSLTELADHMRSLGAYQAMNLDGGGSSTLWIRGSIVNYPSDAAGERTVGNALVVKQRPRTP